MLRLHEDEVSSVALSDHEPEPTRNAHEVGSNLYGALLATTSDFQMIHGLRKSKKHTLPLAGIAAASESIWQFFSSLSFRFC